MICWTFWILSCGDYILKKSRWFCFGGSFSCLDTITDCHAFYVWCLRSQFSSWSLIYNLLSVCHDHTWFHGSAIDFNCVFLKYRIQTLFRLPLFWGPINHPVVLIALVFVTLIFLAGKLVHQNRKMRNSAHADHLFHVLTPL